MPAKAAPKKATPAPTKASKVAAKPVAKAAAKVAGKAVAKAAAKAAPVVPKTDPRCVSRPKALHLGGDIVPKGTVDVTRFTRWPRYVWRQRRVQILQKRLKVPPSINQFSKTLDSDIRKEIFRFAAKYAPESKKERTQRLKAIAAAKTVAGKDVAVPKAKVSLRCGLKCVTRLVEHGRAKLVLIAHDVAPLELVMFLPALCRKQNIPYAIVKGKALLGKLAGFKEATAIAFEKINEEDAAAFQKIQQSIAASYAPVVEENRRKWGGLALGRASQDKVAAAIANAKRQEAAIAGALNANKA